MIDHPRVEGVNDVLPGPTISRELNYYDSINPSTEIVSSIINNSILIKFGMQFVVVITQLYRVFQKM